MIVVLVCPWCRHHWRTVETDGINSSRCEWPCGPCAARYPNLLYLDSGTDIINCGESTPAEIRADEFHVSETVLDEGGRP